MSSIGIEPGVAAPSRAVAQGGFSTTDWSPELAEAIEAVAALDAVGGTLANPNMLLRPLHVGEAVASLRIEGIDVTPTGVLIFDLHPFHSESPDDPRLPLRAGSNVIAALDYGAERLQEVPFDGVFLRRLGNAMNFKLPSMNATGSASASQTFTQSAPLETLLAAEPPRHRRLVHAFDVHRRLASQRPHTNISGRTARAALMLMIHHLHRHRQPWLGLSSFFAANRAEFVRCLHGDSAGWIRFCLQGTATQAKAAVSLCRRLTALNAELDEQALNGSFGPRGRRLVELLFESPIVSVPLIQRRVDLPFNTAKRDVQRLCEEGLLVEIPSEGVRVFECGRILEAWMEGILE